MNTDQNGLGRECDAGANASEQWRAIPGWPGYEASTLGRIRSLDRRNAAGHRIRGIMRKLTMDRFGYVTVPLTNEGRKKSHMVARLVALTWIPLPDGVGEATYLEVGHINGQVSDNRALNLEWRTAQQNRMRGEDAGRAKLRNSDVRAIRSLAAEGVHIATIARAYRLPASTIRKVVRRTTWRHLR